VIGHRVSMGHQAPPSLRVTQRRGGLAEQSAHPWRPLVDALVAALSAGAALAVLAPVPDEATSVAYATGSAGVAVATWLRGPVAGILTVLLTASGVMVMHLHPIVAFTATGVGDVAGLALFGLSGFVVVRLAGWSHAPRVERGAGRADPCASDLHRPHPVGDRRDDRPCPLVRMANPTRMPLVEPLTAREIEVLEALAAGRSNEEIAASLFISLNTVKSHLKTIYGKLGVHSRTQAAARGLGLGLITVSDIDESAETGLSARPARRAA
jgi:DNA-binding CsgD family transcriptional regulator